MDMHTVGCKDINGKWVLRFYLIRLMKNRLTTTQYNRGQGEGRGETLGRSADRPADS